MMVWLSPGVISGSAEKSPTRKIMLTGMRKTNSGMVRGVSLMKIASRDGTAVRSSYSRALATQSETRH